MKPTLLLLSAIVALSACNKQHEGTGGVCGTPGTDDSGCPIGIICTMDFRSITITVKQNGSPVALDSYKTIRVSDNQEFNLMTTANTWEDSVRKATGIYPILTDSERKSASRSGTVFEFMGFKNGVLVTKSKYTISNDCCHIHLDTGNTVID